MTPEQIALLNASLDAKHVKQRTQAGRSLSYVEGWFAIAEANRIFGHDGWSSETVEIKCVWEGERSTRSGMKPACSYVAKVRVRVDDVTREGVGAGHGMGDTPGDAHESAIKEAETDARKRGLMTFGWPFGLALYDKEQTHVTNGHDQGRPSPTPESPAKDADSGARDAATDIEKKALNARSVDELNGIWKSHWPTIKTLPVARQNELTTYFGQRKKLLLEAEQTPIGAG